MGDISFKVSGDSKPFLAKLWNSDCSELLQQKPVEYSGACITFSLLEGSTTYNVNIVDNIGYSISKSYITGTALVPPVLINKVLCVCGIVNSPSTFIKQITSPKIITVVPSLNVGESVDITFTIHTCNTSNTQNSITLYCNNTPQLPVYSNCGVSSKLINMKYGDSICYDMTTYSTNNAGNICGCSRLTISNAIGYGFNATTSSGTNYKYTDLSISAVRTISASQNTYYLQPSQSNQGVVPIITTSTGQWELEWVSNPALKPSWIQAAFTYGNSGESPEYSVSPNNTTSVRSVNSKIWLKDFHDVFVIISITI